MNPLRLGRRRRVDRLAFPLDYLGPDTAAGLDHGTPCRVLRSWAGGGYIITTPGGSVWTVAKTHVRRPVS